MRHTQRRWTLQIAFALSCRSSWWSPSPGRRAQPWWLCPTMRPKTQPLGLLKRASPGGEILFFRFKVDGLKIELSRMRLVQQVSFSFATTMQSLTKTRKYQNRNRNSAGAYCRENTLHWNMKSTEESREISQRRRKKKEDRESKSKSYVFVETIEGINLTLGSATLYSSSDNSSLMRKIYIDKLCRIFLSMGFYNN